ncbi:hypothetical protein DL96DRAFT_1559760 [Flagelloscypha sp. PMI_526]|nr:hypothetical protein DL96DRAFT_1559760 [Flagelloscypha sp. PMI_526]
MQFKLSAFIAVFVVLAASSTTVSACYPDYCLSRMLRQWFLPMLNDMEVKLEIMSRQTTTRQVLGAYNLIRFEGCNPDGSFASFFSELQRNLPAFCSKNWRVHVLSVVA